jgi:UDP-N-acetylglucosamine 1-carboxyvinyltransferase
MTIMASEELYQGSLMDKLIITGGRTLNGEVRISGAKNSCLPILAASLLTEEKCIISNVPDLRDVKTMIEIMKNLGKVVISNGDVVEVGPGPVKNVVAAYDLVSTMRASVCVLGPLLGRYGEAKVSFPGGCVIGPRPIDLHLKGLKALGADIEVKEGYINANCRRLIGTAIYLGGHFGSSVLATINTLLASVLAEGETVIEDAACEPEVSDLVLFLRSMGADITGGGTPTIRVRGVKELHGAEHDIISDRIEAGTYMIAGIMTGGRIKLRNTLPDNNLALIDKLTECGGAVERTADGVEVYRKKKRLSSTHITTLTYPGFPTDLQAQMMSLLTLCGGISVITEKIYPERFIHISELNRMGAGIILEGSTAIVNGVRSLSGARVMASDLRASAALVLAGLVAEGSTEISRIYHLDRGYENMEGKLSSIGAEIERVKE